MNRSQRFNKKAKRAKTLRQENTNHINICNKMIQIACTEESRKRFEEEGTFFEDYILSFRKKRNSILNVNTINGFPLISTSGNAYFGKDVKYLFDPAKENSLLTSEEFLINTIPDGEYIIYTQEQWDLYLKNKNNPTLIKIEDEIAEFTKEDFDYLVDYKSNLKI